MIEKSLEMESHLVEGYKKRVIEFHFCLFIKVWDS